ncbi:MAG: rhodanese-like domain-containing protein [Spirochaetes bacterium]|jgi:rhodanese-related sulfurtransferase|nr:rhodanese-like domain-containing protein [Spirochaetota bacterium]
MIGKTLKESAVIIASCAALGLLLNIVNPDGFEPVPKKSAGGRVVQISPREARIKLDSAGTVLLDASSRGEFASRRIRGAISVPSRPAGESYAAISDNRGQINSDRELVIYCGSGSCGLSMELAEKIGGMGYSRHIYIIKGGIEAWTAEGFPVETGGGK